MGVRFPIKASAKLGDVGLDSLGEKTRGILQLGPRADVDGLCFELFLPLEDPLGGHPLAKMENEIGAGLFNPVEIFDLLDGWIAAGVGEDVGTDGPLEPLCELEYGKNIVWMGQAPDEDQPF